MSLLFILVLLAQCPSGQDVPALEPRAPLAAKDQARQRALELYAKSLLFERDTDLLQALKALEAARALDPDAPALHKALTQLYLALERPEEALASGARALELDPGDVETAYLHSRHLRNRKRFVEAAAVLARALEKQPGREQIDHTAQLALDLASACEEIPDLGRTEEALRKALALLEQREAVLDTGKITPRDLTILTAETYERLAQVGTRLKKDQAALAAFARARTLDPERGPRLAFHLAQLHEQHQRPAQALTSLEEYLGTRPLGTEAQEMKVRLLRALNRSREVIPFLEKAVTLDPENPGLPLLLGKEYVRANRADLAERLYRQSLRKHPTREVAQGLVQRLVARQSGDELLALLDRLLTEAGKTDPPSLSSAAQGRALLGAIRQEEQAVTLMLGALRTRLAQDNLGGTTVYTFAELAAEANQLDLAERLFRAALRQNTPDNLEHEIYGGLLRVLRKANRHQAIVEVCRQGLTGAEATNRVLFHSYLAQAQLALGKVQEALAAADDAVNDSGERNRLSMRRNRALILAEVGKVPEAVTECQALLREYNQAGDVAQIRHALASVWSMGKNPVRAEEQLKILIRDDPTNATAYNDLAYQYAEQNRNLDEAVLLAHKALELDRRQRTTGTQVELDSDQDNGAFVDTLGWIYFRQGKLAQARKELERATRLPAGKESPVIWDHLGDVLTRLDAVPEARKAYEKAIRLHELEGRRRADETVNDIRKKLLLLQQ